MKFLKRESCWHVQGGQRPLLWAQNSVEEMLQRQSCLYNTAINCNQIHFFSSSSAKILGSPTLIWNKLINDEKFFIIFICSSWKNWEKAMAPHSSTVARKIPWMEEPGRLQSMGSHRVGHDWSDLAAAAAERTRNGLLLVKCTYLITKQEIVWCVHCRNIVRWTLKV